MTLHHDIHGRVDRRAAPTLILSSGLGGRAPTGRRRSRRWRAIFASSPTIIAARTAAAAGGRTRSPRWRTTSSISRRPSARALSPHGACARRHDRPRSRAPGGSPVESLVLVNAWGKARPPFRPLLRYADHASGEQASRPSFEAQPLFLYPAVWMAGDAQRLAAEDRPRHRAFSGAGRWSSRASRPSGLRRRSAARRDHGADPGGGGTG